MQISISINDYSDEVLRKLADKIPVALEKCGLVAEGYSKRLCPVDTGNLRNSITHEVRGKTVYIGTNVEYAVYVEMGTSRTRSQPYLKPAIQNNVKEYQEIIVNTLK